MARESQLSNWGARQTQKEQRQSIRQVGNQLPTLLLQQTSLLFKGDLSRTHGEDRVHTLRLPKEPYQAPLAITGAWMKGNCLPAKYRLCGNFHQPGILSRMLGWPDTSGVPRSLVGDGSANTPLWEHMQKGHSRVKSILTIILKGHMVQMKLTWYDLHSFKWRSCTLTTEILLGKHGLESIIMAVSFRTQWASNFHGHFFPSSLCWGSRNNVPSLLCCP